MQIGHRKLIFYWSRKVVYSPCYCLLSGPFVKMFVNVNAKQICLWEQNKVTWIKLPYIYQENQTKCLSFGMKNKDRKTLFVLQCFLVNIVVDISVLSTHSLRYIKVTAQQETVFHIGMHFWCQSSAHFLDSCLLKSLYL